MMEANATAPTKHIELLTAVLPDCSTEEKFCIIRLFQLYPDDWFALPGITDIAKMTGVSYVQAKRAIDFLEASKRLIRRREFVQDAPVDEVGLLLPDCFENHKAVALSKKLQAKKKNQPINYPSPSQATLHQNLIEGVLGEKTHDLKTSNRLLLATLLRYANEAGTVRNLGMADLGRLVGMRKDGLSSQIQKLKNLGYIRTSFGGVTGTHLFGIQNGAFFLNLKHPAHGQRRKKGITVILQDQSNKFAPIRSMARNFSIAAKALPALTHIRSLETVPTNAPQETSIPYIGKDFTPAQLSSISGFFNDQIGTGIIDYYQLKLEEYASYLLSRRFQELGGLKKPSGELNPERIAEEVIPLKQRRQIGADGKHSDKTPVYHMVNATSLLADHMARCISRSLAQYTQLNWHHMNIEILPATSTTDNRLGVADIFTIECTFKDQMYADQGCWVICKAPDGNYSTYEVDEVTATSLTFQTSNRLRESPKEARPFPKKEKNK